MATLGLLAQPLLLITITSMVLISIHPFASKRIFLVVGALLCLSSAFCFADPLLMSLHGSPYARDLNRRPSDPVSIQKRTVVARNYPAAQSSR